jgi:hypothetical protein
LEQGQPDPRLKRPDRLTDGARRHAEFGSRGTKARVVGNGEKLRKAGKDINPGQNSSSRSIGN